MTHLLVTNDFPPKVGGIQNYLYELWSRLPPERFAVLSVGHDQAAAFDARQPFRIERIDTKMLLPTASIQKRIETIASEIGADAIVLDPALPIGWIGHRLGLPYGVVLHGAEVTVPGRVPGSRQVLARVLSEASLVIAAGRYPLAEARRAAGGTLPPSVVVPPGVDTVRFHPLTPEERSEARAHFGLPATGEVIVSMSRLVPRKGFDVLIEATALLASEGRDLVLAIAGSGRDRARLEKLAEKCSAPVHFFGRVGDDELPRLLGSADCFAMLCRTRWLGLEQEGFGIVFLEAAASGVPQIAGRSGGVRDAVVDEVTGLVVDRPGDVVPSIEALRRMLDDRALRANCAEAGRRRAAEEFDYPALASQLDAALVDLEEGKTSS